MLAAQDIVDSYVLYLFSPSPHNRQDHQSPMFLKTPRDYPWGTPWGAPRATGDRRKFATFLYCSSCPHRPACIPPPPQDQCCLKIRGPAPRAFRGQKFATAKTQIFNIESGGVGGQMQICAFACIHVRRCRRCVSLNGGCELLSAYCLVFAFFSGILCCYVCRDGILLGLFCPVRYS